MDTTKLLGKSVKVYLKLGGAFNFKVTGIGLKFITGFDEEGMNLLIHLNDIDFIVLDGVKL